MTVSSAADTQPSSVRHQYLGAICANLVHLSLGASLGWLLITSTGLQTHHRSHLGVDPLADVELTWVIGSFWLSGIVGTAFVSWMADGIGRKHTLCTLSLVQLLSWGLYMIATNATEMYIAGMMAGFAGGGSLVIVLLFIAEIAEDHVRGILVASTVLCLHVGQALAIVPLFWLPSKECTFGLTALPMVFLFAFVYYPDTPFQLRKENQKELSLKSLHLYRGARLPAHQYTDYIKKEVLKFHQTVVDVPLLKANFVTRSATKTFLIIAALSLPQQCASTFIQLLYTDRLAVTLLWRADAMSLVWAALQVVGALAAFGLVERVGRRALLLGSTLGTALAMGALAICVHLDYQSTGVLTALIGAVVLVASVGLLPLPYVLLVDLMPQQIRTMGITVCLSASWLLAFGLYMLSVATIFDVAIFAYTTAALCVLAVAVVALVVPGTRRLSNDEIVREMERR